MASNKVTKYRRPLNINVGLIIFAVILIYTLISVFTYATSEKVVGYEVKTGSLSANRVYHGIALRTEHIVESEYSGYINFYSEEGDRLGKGNLAYTIDESGQIIDYINAQNTGDVTFSKSELAELRGEITSFTSDFDARSFSGVYDFRSTIMSKTQNLSSSSILESIRNMDTSGLSASIHYCYAPVTGDVVYATDGYEEKTFDALSIADFDRTDYEKKQIANGQLVSQGDPVCRISTDENWSIVFLAEGQEEADELVEMDYVRVRFLKNQDESWAKVRSRTDEQGNVFVSLSFTNSMVTFCADRFIDIELITSDRQGLKVPNTAIIESYFFLVPKEFVTTGRGGDKGVLKQTYAEDGSMSTSFIYAPPYSEAEGEYYLDESVLKAGDVLVKPDSTDTYTLSRQDKLIGVYNINKGYADFRIIDILYSGDEYSIVDPNTTYGLSEYDYIVLDAQNISPDQFIYE